MRALHSASSAQIRFTQENLKSTVTTRAGHRSASLPGFAEAVSAGVGWTYNSDGKLVLSRVELSERFPEIAREGDGGQHKTAHRFYSIALALKEVCLRHGF
jgi:hypothetical protein